MVGAVVQAGPSCRRGRSPARPRRVSRRLHARRSSLQRGVPADAEPSGRRGRPRDARRRGTTARQRAFNGCRPPLMDSTHALARLRSPARRAGRCSVKDGPRRRARKAALVLPAGAVVAASICDAALRPPSSGSRWRPVRCGRHGIELRSHVAELNDGRLMATGRQDSAGELEGGRLARVRAAPWRFGEPASTTDRQHISGNRVGGQPRAGGPSRRPVHVSVRAGRRISQHGDEARNRATKRLGAPEFPCRQLPGAQPDPRGEAPAPRLRTCGDRSLGPAR